MFEFEKVCREAEKLKSAEYGAAATVKSVEVLAQISNIVRDGFTGMTLYTGLPLGAIVSDGKITLREKLWLKKLIK